MSKETNKTILVVGLGVLTLGAIYWLYNQLSLAMKYCYKIKDFKINKLGLNDTNLTIFVAVKNFSSIQATVQKLDLDIFVNDILVSKVLNNDVATVIAANSVSNVKIDVQFSLKEILKTDMAKATQLLIDLTTNKDAVKITTKGVMALQVGAVNIKNINVDVTMTVKDILADDPNAFVCDIS